MQYILDNTTSVIYIKDTHGRYILVNRQYQNLFHISKEEAVGKTDYDVFPKETADAFQVNDRKVLRTQAPLEIEDEQDELEKEGKKVVIWKARYRQVVNYG